MSSRQRSAPIMLMDKIPIDILLIILEHFVCEYIPHPRKRWLSITPILNVRLVSRSFNSATTRTLHTLITLPNLPVNFHLNRYRSDFGIPACTYPACSVLNSSDAQQTARRCCNTFVDGHPGSGHLIPHHYGTDRARNSLLASAIWNSTRKMDNRLLGTSICRFMRQAMQFAFTLTITQGKSCAEVGRVLCSAVSESEIAVRRYLNVGDMNNTDRWCIAILLGDMEYILRVDNKHREGIKIGRISLVPQPRGGWPASIVFGDPVSCAVYAGHEDVVAFLLSEAGPFLGPLNMMSMSDVENAMLASRLDIVSLLMRAWVRISKGASPPSRGPYCVCEFEDLVLGVVLGRNIEALRCITDAVSMEDLEIIKGRNVFFGRCTKGDTAHGHFSKYRIDYNGSGKGAGDIAKEQGDEDIKALLEEKGLSQARAGGRFRVVEWWLPCEIHRANLKDIEGTGIYEREAKNRRMAKTHGTRSLGKRILDWMLLEPVYEDQ